MDPGRVIKWERDELEPHEVYRILLAHAKETLAPGTRFIVVRAVPEYYGTKHSMGWIEVATEPGPWKEGALDVPEWVPDKGYYVWGRGLV